jgi:hypothetical protein
LPGRRDRISAAPDTTGVPYGFEQLLARLAEIGYLQRVRLMRQPQAHAIARAIPRQLNASWEFMLHG